MTRDELKDLACLGFSADLVMQVKAPLLGGLRAHMSRLLRGDMVCLFGPPLLAAMISL